MTSKTDVEFAAADGTVLSAWLFQPDDVDGLLPAITMAHGFGATKWHGLEQAAEAFAAAGFVVLVHDHRNFGTSGGFPRGDIDPWAQIADWRRAISYLESLDDVNPQRIGLWGTSYAGGHALVLAATDRRVSAVVSQAPTIDGWESGSRRVAPQDVAALEEAFNDDERAQLRGEPPRTQRFVSADPAAPASYHSSDTYDFYHQPIPAGVWSNDMTLQSVRRSRMYEPGRWITRISPTPLLLIEPTHDTTAPTDLALRAFEQAHEPKALVLIDGGHYSVYLEQFPKASDAAVSFFREHLGSSNLLVRSEGGR
jgi:fermentation-respiration switch protein FrsA (DUF1100 family)